MFYIQSLIQKNIYVIDTVNPLIVLVKTFEFYSISCINMFLDRVNINIINLFQFRFSFDRLVL